MFHERDYLARKSPGVFLPSDFRNYFHIYCQDDWISFQTCEQSINLLLTGAWVISESEVCHKRVFCAEATPAKSLLAFAATLYSNSELLFSLRWKSKSGDEWGKINLAHTNQWIIWSIPLSPLQIKKSIQTKDTKYELLLQKSMHQNAILSYSQCALKNVGTNVHFQLDNST